MCEFSGRMELNRWQEVTSSVLDAQQTIENIGRQQQLTSLSIGALGRAAIAYFDIVVAVCTWLARGKTHFSRSPWNWSCLLTSLGLVVACILSFSTAPLVHELISDIAELMYGINDSYVCRVVLLDVFVDVLSNLIYWVMVGLGISIYLMMTVGSLIVGVAAVAFGVVGICLALKHDPNILRSARM